jgi:hypothetical protein
VKLYDRLKPCLIYKMNVTQEENVYRPTFIEMFFNYRRSGLTVLDTRYNILLLIYIG